MHLAVARLIEMVLIQIANRIQPGAWLSLSMPGGFER